MKQKSMIVSTIIALGLLWTNGYAGWMKTYGGYLMDEGNSVQQTKDGGYIVTGVIDIDENLQGGDLYLIKIDAYGDTLWTKTYGGKDVTEGYSVLQTKDGGYIVVGNIYPSGASQSDLWIIKTDEKGDTLWTKTYDGGADDAGYEIQQTKDSCYVIAGGISSDLPPLKQQFWLLKIDAKGDTLWTKNYGGNEWDGGYSVKELHDGGYIIGGVTNSFGLPTGYIWLLRTNANGDTLWTKTISGPGWSWANSIDVLKEGGFIIAGATSPSSNELDVYIVKTDSLGNPGWEKTYPNKGVDRGQSVRQTSDSGFIVAGTKESSSNYDVWLLKLNKEGDTLWTKLFGGIEYDWGSSVQQTKDGGYIVAGGTESFGFGAGMSDVWLIKTDSLGIAEGVEEKSAHSPNRLFLTLSTFRPFEVLYNISSASEVSFDVFDATGRRLANLNLGKKEKGEYKFSLSLDKLPAGVYFCQLKTDTQVISKKVILVR